MVSQFVPKSGGSLPWEYSAWSEARARGASPASASFAAGGGIDAVRKVGKEVAPRERAQLLRRLAAEAAAERAAEKEAAAEKAAAEKAAAAKRRRLRQLRREC